MDRIFRSTYGRECIRKQDRVNAEARLVRSGGRNPGLAEVRVNPERGIHTCLGAPQL